MGISTFPPPSTGGGGVNYKVDRFLTAGTWTAPAGVTAAEVFVVSGGGGGGGTAVAPGASQRNAAGGGGGGGVVTRIVPITAGSAYVVTVGAGGAGGSFGVGASEGANGNTSSFGTLVSVVGGGAGKRDPEHLVNVEVASYGGTGYNINDSAHEAAGGGGGGMFPVSSNVALWGLDSTDSGDLQFSFGAAKYGSGAMPAAEQAKAQGATARVVVGNPGVDGFGAGGAGGYSSGSWFTYRFGNLGGANAGRGAYTSGTVATNISATNGSANFGGGGGGGASFGTAAEHILASGNGGSGYVEVRYWA